MLFSKKFFIMQVSYTAVAQEVRLKTKLIHLFSVCLGLIALTAISLAPLSSARATSASDTWPGETQTCAVSSDDDPGGTTGGSTGGTVSEEDIIDADPSDEVVTGG